jgi:glycerophosphoryl diester phosphodiesterase
VFIQSFETANLRKLRSMTDLHLVQLLDEATLQPYDVVAAGGAQTYGDLMTPKGLAEIATYADGIGPWKDSIVPRDADQHLLEPTSLVDDAHAAGLTVHPYTFRRENTFLPVELRQGDPDSPNYDQTMGDFPAELRMFFDLGVDGIFTDDSDVAVAVRTAWLADSRGNLTT